MHHGAHLIVGHRDEVDALRGQRLAHRRHVDRIAAENFARIGDDLGADMPGHHDRAFDVRRVDREIRHQRLGEPLHRELGGAVGRVRPARTDRCPKSVDAAGVDDVAFARLHQHRQERARAVIDAAPADVERLLPLRAIAADDAAAAADAGIVEEQMDVIRVEFARARRWPNR